MILLNAMVAVFQCTDNGFQQIPQCVGTVLKIWSLKRQTKGATGVIAC